MRRLPRGFPQQERRVLGRDQAHCSFGFRSARLIARDRPGLASMNSSISVPARPHEQRLLDEGGKDDEVDKLRRAAGPLVRVEETYGVENLGPYDNFEWGMLNGTHTPLTSTPVSSS
jgi:hypothetical protein